MPSLYTKTIPLANGSRKFSTIGSLVAKPNNPFLPPILTKLDTGSTFWKTQPVQIQTRPTGLREAFALLQGGALDRTEGAV
jgi:hypothetical protein